MKIYPKTCENLNGLKYLKKYVEKYKGIEIQLLSFECIDTAYNTIKRLREEFVDLEEVTVHLPLVKNDQFNFEALAFSRLDKEKDRLKVLLQASKEFNLKVNLLYHTKWDCQTWISSGAIEKMNELIEFIQDTNVYILIENIHSLVAREKCWVLDIAKRINNEHFKVCLDICHLHCEANIFRLNFDEFLNTYMEKPDCKKYIHQIHFAGTLNNDGYIDEKGTHGRVHDSFESFEKDYSILNQFGIEDKIIVTEISEEDYSLRTDQIKEIEMLMKKEEK